MNEYIETNRRHWDETVAHHVDSDFYDVASFKAGRSTLLPLERAELGDVRGKTLLHLQCHFGLDTLSWAREGAIVTGVDFSAEAIRTARNLATELNLDARFLEANVYDLPSVLDAQFDIVFASYGVIAWLPDIAAWARVAASYVRPGGTFYLAEIHPLLNSIWDSPSANDVRMRHSYFGGPEPELDDADGTYATSDSLQNRRNYQFWHPLGNVVTSVIAAGLRLEYLHEFPYCCFAALPGMTRHDDGTYHLPEGAPQIPLLFSLRATKPA